MYIGRFVIVGKTPAGQWYLCYRVSSRSFPHRYIKCPCTTGYKPGTDRAVVLPTADAPASDNPYISYNCLRSYADVVVVANGSHVDPIIDKISLGYALRDAMALSLLTLDYEHDRYNTPRVAAGLDAGRGYLGIVAEDKLLVREMAVSPGQAFLVATYERTDPTPIRLAGTTPQALCDAIYEAEYEHPVAALAVLPVDGNLSMAVRPVH